LFFEYRLETVYGAFDSIAKRRHVFKVETIGDCYVSVDSFAMCSLSIDVSATSLYLSTSSLFIVLQVAVAGLPEPRDDHALVMARFARECLTKMGDVTQGLEQQLGPETGELTVSW
jgi:hypothetical protein